MLALLAMKTERPVRLVFTREESIATTAKRHPSRTHYRMGLTKDGRITAASIRRLLSSAAWRAGRRLRPAPYGTKMARRGLGR